MKSEAEQLEEEAYYDSVLGSRSVKRYVGKDKPQIQRHYHPTSRREGYPWNTDGDYDPRIDDVDEERED